MRRSFQKPFPKLIRRWIKDGGSIFKEYKIIDFTRPIEFGTMTNKVATRNPTEIWLWKRLRAPSCYSAEQTLPGYTVFFKGRAQFIHDSCQRHSKTTWTRGRLTGISLPKYDVMLDHVLICAGQSQGRVDESTRHICMRERVPHHKTSFICQNGLPSTIPMKD
jgi:hypothetical protein